jgi:hypothetical protein
MLKSWLPQPNPHKGDVKLITFYSFIVNFIVALGLGFSKVTPLERNLQISDFKTSPDTIIKTVPMAPDS